MADLRYAYKQFQPDDVIEGTMVTQTAGIWTGGVGELSTFWTSSAQDSTSKTYYYDILNTGSGCDSEVQFSVAWGHRDGSGSLLNGSTNDSVSKAVYSQYKQMCLEPEDTAFTFSDGSSGSSIYVINVKRDRMQDKLDPGNFELALTQLSGSSGQYVATGSTFVTLIDDSGQATDSTPWNGLTSPVYRLISGSIADGAYATTGSWGLVYPDLGVIILNGVKVDSTLSFITNTGSDVNGNNALRLFTSISGAAMTTVGRATAYPFKARNVTLKTQAHYFVRIGSKEYNFTNNPTILTGSSGDTLNDDFKFEPKTYITSVGLYDRNYQLLAVAKMSKPIAKSFVEESLVTIKLEY